MALLTSARSLCLPLLAVASLAEAAITRTPKGTSEVKDLPVGAWTALTNVTVADGASLVVLVSMNNSPRPTSVAWNGHALALDVGTVEGLLHASIYSAHGLPGGTGDLVFSFAFNATIAIAATQVEGLAASSATDRTAEAKGTTATATAGPTALTQMDEELVVGAVATRGPVEDPAGTWGGDTPLDGQRAGTTGQSANSNATISEGYGLQSSAGVRTLQKTGLASLEWAAVIATYRAASGGGQPTADAGAPPGDGGAPASDGGQPGPGRANLGVGCDCTAAPAAAIGTLLLCGLWLRRHRRAG